MSHKTAAIIVVGDEILKGQTIDTNSPFMAKRLFALGIRVPRIAVVADDVEDIATEVKKWSGLCDHVFTCGGIGPTHDDLTYEGVAKAFDQPLVLNKEMKKVIVRFLGVQKSQKMAMLPESAKLLGMGPELFPVIQVRNVFVLPGVPRWCEDGFLRLENTLASGSAPFYVLEVRVLADEMAILPAINDTVKRYQGRVSIGSYPISASDGSFLTRLTLESNSLDVAAEARAFLLDSLPCDLIDFNMTSDDAKKVLDLANGVSHFSKTVAHSIQVIKDGLKKYSLNETFLSFNGGKDCNVLVHLLWAVALQTGPKPIRTIYIKCQDPFPEISNFIEECEGRYGLVLETTDGPIKPALEKLVTKYPEVKAVWMGTRRTDPYSLHLEPFQMCDAGWPALERINPLLDWNYDDVWLFLRLLSVPYCKLYDEGYTSLGHRGNTTKNPHLLDTINNKYNPAYMLKDGEREREGRK